MSPELRQLRQSFADRIKRNKSLVSYFVNGTLKTEVVRLVHESASVPTNRTNPVGLGTSFSMFCQLYHDSTVQEGTLLIVGGKGWKTGPVDDLRADCGVYGKRSPLTKIDILSATKAITSLKIGTAIGVISGTDITVTLPLGTDITAITPIIIQTGKAIEPFGAQDFTAPKDYKVTAEDLSSVKYNIKVVLA